MKPMPYIAFDQNNKHYRVYFATIEDFYELTKDQQDRVIHYAIQQMSKKNEITFTITSKIIKKYKDGKLFEPNDLKDQ